MNYKLSVLSLVAAAVLMVSGIDTSTQAGPKKKLLRVGVYDSRGIVMAYVHSAYNDNFMQKASQQKKEAEAAGDLEKARQLDEQMDRYGLRRHQQIFSTAPVHGLMEPIKDQLPALARQAGVDVIVSQWDVDYLAVDGEVVDVTLEIAKLFNPEPGVDASIKQLMQTKTLTEEEVERLEKEHPH
jgi:hypothetical protein